jgi:hypothetical protein
MPTRDNDLPPIGGFKDAQRRTLARIEKALSEGNTAEVDRLVTFVKTWWRMDPKDYHPGGVMPKETT